MTGCMEVIILSRFWVHAWLQVCINLDLQYQGFFSQDHNETALIVFQES